MIRDIFPVGLLLNTLLFIHSFHCFEYSTSEIRSSDRNLRNIEGDLTWEKIKIKTKNAFLFAFLWKQYTLWASEKNKFFIKVSTTRRSYLFASIFPNLKNVHHNFIGLLLLWEDCVIRNYFRISFIDPKRHRERN